MASKSWFLDWFDTPYYHKLYAHRDFKEAERFMKQLTAFLSLPKGSRILDIPCGRGRHAVYLNALGYDVTGIDLSGQNIKYARRFEKEGLKFYVRDMREPLDEQYNTIFNLFTSFGYFSDEENRMVLKNFKAALKPGGVIVIDFLNVSKVCAQLISEEEITADGIVFNIKRNLMDGFLIKDIDFEDAGKAFHFEERVRCLDIDSFEQMIAQTGLKIESVFGDYDLNAFDPVNSERLILIVQ